MTATLAAPRPAEMPAVTIVKIEPKLQKRLRLYDGLVEAGLEILALATTAVRSLVASRTPDTLHDRAVQAGRRQARLGFEESQICGCNGWRRFAAIDQHLADAERHDRAEDGLIAKAAGCVQRIFAIGRGMNLSLTRELAKRAAGKARR